MASPRRSRTGPQRRVVRVSDGIRSHLPKSFINQLVADHVAHVSRYPDEDYDSFIVPPDLRVVIGTSRTQTLIVFMYELHAALPRYANGNMDTDAAVRLFFKRHGN